MWGGQDEVQSAREACAQIFKPRPLINSNAFVKTDVWKWRNNDGQLAKTVDFKESSEETSMILTQSWQKAIADW